MDKQVLATQLLERLKETVAVSEREGTKAAEHARNGATAQEKREDGRTSMEFGSLARGQRLRAQQGRFEVAAVESFHPQPFKPGALIKLG
ncbi:MAG: hypothetical protein ACI9WU_005429, partial [Myxococcota bacterium]